MVLFIGIVMSRSFVYNRNGNGASTVPCGTLEVTGCGSLDTPSD